MAVELKQHFVAFLDLLGFKSMVQADSAAETDQYLSKLFRCHQSAGTIFGGNPNCQIIQFSDSIVVSTPYEADGFEWFAEKISEYQRFLLDEEILCRGGIAVDKHFSNGTFTFSAGLISAYKVESESARYPRIVVSEEVIQLLYPEESKISKFLAKEDDGLYFIDYIGSTKRKKPKKLIGAINNLIASLSSNHSPSVREKGLWLATYSDSTLDTKLCEPRFKGKNIKT